MAEKVPLTLLYVEDEPDLRERVRIVLAMHFDRVLTAANGREGLERFRQERPALVVSDIMMPVMDGLEMTREIRAESPATPVILSTAFTETGFLLKAIELGVAAYVRKPLDCRQLVETIMQAARPILQQVELEQARCREQASLEALLGDSPAMQQVIQQARRIAATDFSVVIHGETGAGKSHLAALIHDLSSRKRRSFVTVSVGSIPESLVESQLFGHVRGAFTGAVTARSGLFGEADGGTLFLDDIDCASPAIQAKILHAVEQKRFFPVGGTRQVTVDTRVVAASNRNLQEEARNGRFREDLYYRLGDLVITLPPLRERGEDVVMLARSFLNGIARELDRTPPRISADAQVLLRRHAWPGNIRELKSVMKRAALFAGDLLDAADLAAMLQGDGVPCALRCPVPTLAEVERTAILRALEAANGRKMEAARLLAVEYGRFKRMLARHGLPHT